MQLALRNDFFPSSNEIAQLNHLTERGRASACSSANNTGRPRRSVLPLGPEIPRRHHQLRGQRDNGKIKPMRQAIIYPGEDGFWVAECPSLPGCISQGETREAAISNIREAIKGYVLALQDDGIEVPEERFEALLVAV